MVSSNIKLSDEARKAIAKMCSDTWKDDYPELGSKGKSQVNAVYFMIKQNERKKDQVFPVQIVKCDEGGDTEKGRWKNIYNNLEKIKDPMAANPDEAEPLGTCIALAYLEFGVHRKLLLLHYTAVNTADWSEPRRKRLMRMKMVYASTMEEVKKEVTGLSKGKAIALDCYEDIDYDDLVKELDTI